jgi:hypothetical protein
MLVARDLPFRVRFEEDRGVKDGSGQHASDYQLVCERWANVQLVTADRYSKLRLRYPDATWAILVRHDVDTAQLAAPQRVRWPQGDMTFQILGPGLDPDGNRRELHVPVVERQLARRA